MKKVQAMTLDEIKQELKEYEKLTGQLTTYDANRIRDLFNAEQHILSRKTKKI